MTITGSCLCGGVRFELERASGPFELCHCPRCRKATGSGFAAMLTVRGDELRLLEGEDLIERYDAPVVTAPPPYRRTFCRRCGSPVPDVGDGAEWVEVPAGLLDGDPQVRPDKHIYVEHEPAWSRASDDLPRMTKAMLGEWRRQRS